MRRFGALKTLDEKTFLPKNDLTVKLKLFKSLNQNLSKMTSKILKTNSSSVKKLKGRLLIWYSDMLKTANGHITLLELNLSHTMVRTEGTYCKKYNIFSANKKVWEYGRDYYTNSNDYQKYQRHFGNNGVASCKLTEISLSINMHNLNQWIGRDHIRNPVAKIRSNRYKRRRAVLEV